VLLIGNRVQQILNDELLERVYKHKFPWAKGRQPTGAQVGAYCFQPTQEWEDTFSEMIFEPALVPLSKIPLDMLLELDLVELLLPPASDPRRIRFGLAITAIIDQQRDILVSGYARRYMRHFFDPLAEKFARQLLLPFSPQVFYTIWTG
jgi:hypothetical protein